ncbi:cellulase family glycosylhydrolase [Nocardioides sp. LML1-1-1.1]|uniref:cellulase family glycosylhydrolase n=1 Tax=Nocardioides sp. LML1-1-1.1 TaxID=3135248 RepID=UPI003437C2D4
MKVLLRRGVLVAIIIGTWVAGSVIPWQLGASSESPSAPAASTPAPAPSAPPTRRPRPDDALGYQLSAHHAADAQRAVKVMDALERTGAGWVRVDVGWASLQSRGPGAMDRWYADLLDDVFAAARAHRLRVIVSLWQTPAWASPDGSSYAPPRDVADYARAIGLMSARWGKDVAAWEIWNEPNFDAFFEGADPATYARLLCAAYPAVKKHDDSPVLLGGLMYNDDAWLSRAYRAGAGPCFDALAVHPYVGPSDAAPDTPSVGEVWRLTHMPAMRAVLDEWGDRRKRIWVTELGWSSGPDSMGNAWDRPVSPAVQARYLREAVALIRDRYPSVGPIIWYRDVDGPTRAYADGFGLLRHDLTPKPAFRALRDAVRGR